MVYLARSLLLATVLFPTAVNTQTLDDATFNVVVQKMESDVQLLAQEVERLYENARCNSSTFESCKYNNYDDFLSLYPNQSCPGGNSFLIPLCGDGKSCAGLWDFTVSSVSLPRKNLLDVETDGYHNYPEVIETICFTRALDDWFIKKRKEDYEDWQRLTRTQPQGMYFGSYTGVFRVYPARQSYEHGAFDPRVRPWYVAASSGQKNVIMVLDTSGSLESFSRLDLVKKAAYRVVNTLSLGDRVALVTFNSNASAVTDTKGQMYVATEANKVILNSSIDNLSAGLETNFYSGFEKAFQILASTEKIQCNTAILFLTDGVMKDPYDRKEEFVVDYIREKILAAQSKIGHPILLFTYSVSGVEEGVDSFPQKIACATEKGVWTRIKTFDDVPDSLLSYYRLFSLAIGSSENGRNFTAWVEPYLYKDRGVLGTTVSVPVFDRTKQPPVFIGVVGMDFTIDALNAALGTTNSEDSVSRLAERSKDYCPSLASISECDLEAFRKNGNGDEALCKKENCSTYSDMTPQKCQNNPLYPQYPWSNTGNTNKTYEQRVCCEVGTSTASNQCPATDEKKVGAISGGVVGGLIGVCIILGAATVWYCGGMEENDDQTQNLYPNAPPYDERIELPPPTNPNVPQVSATRPPEAPLSSQQASSDPGST